MDKDKIKELFTTFKAESEELNIPLEQFILIRLYHDFQIDKINRQVERFVVNGLPFLTSLIQKPVKKSTVCIRCRNKKKGSKYYFEYNEQKGMFRIYEGDITNFYTKKQSNFKSIHWSNEYQSYIEFVKKINLGLVYEGIPKYSFETVIERWRGSKNIPSNLIINIPDLSNS